MRPRCWAIVLAIVLAIGGGLVWLARDTQPVQEIRTTIKVAQWMHNFRRKLRDIKKTILNPNPQQDKRSDSL